MKHISFLCGEQYVTLPVGSFLLIRGNNSSGSASYNISLASATDGSYWPLTHEQYCRILDKLELL